MSPWHALFYPLKAGSEETVKDTVRRGRGRPSFDVTDGDGKVIGRLLGTMAFVGKEMAVRVIEVEGAFRMVAAHRSRQRRSASSAGAGDPPGQADATW